MTSPKAGEEGQEVQRPPVNEVVCSIVLERTDTLIGPYLYDVLGHWFTDLPDVRQVPPYEMPPEHPSVRQSVGAPAGAFIELLAGPEASRFWLTSPDEPWLVQVQSDYLALNWRAGQSPEPYVRYEALRERFLDLLEVVGAGMTRRGAALTPVRAEMTYVNLIEPNSVWQKVSDVGNLFDLRLSDSAVVERLAVAYAKDLRVDDTWAGRVHVTLDSRYDLMADTPRLALNITARSGQLPVGSVEGGLAFLDLAHERINETFLGLLTPAARKVWDLDVDDL